MDRVNDLITVCANKYLNAYGRPPGFDIDELVPDRFAADIYYDIRDKMNVSNAALSHVIMRKITGKQIELDRKSRPQDAAAAAEQQKLVDERLMLVGRAYADVVNEFRNQHGGEVRDSDIDRLGGLNAMRSFFIHSRPDIANDQLKAAIEEALREGGVFKAALARKARRPPAAAPPPD